MSALKPELKWTLTRDALPAKPGLSSYEHVWCILQLRNGEKIIRPWNCEHLVWDDEDGDDFAYHPTEPVAWLPLDALPDLPEGAFDATPKA